MTITKSGELASFYTVNKAPIKHLRVYFSPKQAGSGDPSSENVREISGWGGVEVTQCGKNLYDIINYPLVQGAWSGWASLTAGGKSENYATVGSTSYISSELRQRYPCKHLQGLNITLNKRPSGKNPGFNFADENNNYISGSIEIYGNNNKTANVPWTIPIPENAVSMAFTTVPNDQEIQIELGDNSTLYEPYKGQTHSLDWSSSLGTIYGGYVDLITGEVVQEWAQLTSIEIKKDSEQTEGVVFKMITSQDVYDGLGKILSDRFSQNIASGPGRIVLLYTHNLYGIIPKSQMNSYNLTGINQWFNTYNPTFVGKLITPITHQLSPTELQTFLGHNNIWSNADRVEIEYDLAESNDILYRRRNVLENQYPHIITPTANELVSFNTNIKAPLKECKIYFNPIQEGSGDPSPDNIRPITGWTGLSLYHSEGNLYTPNPDNKGYISSSGVINVDTTSTYTDLIPVVVGNTYTFRCITASVNGDTNRRIHGYDSSGNWVEQLAVGTTAANVVEERKILATIPSGISYIRVSFRNQDTNVRFSREEVYDISWENEIGTVYGGYIDLVKGELVETCKGIQLSGQGGSWSWNCYSVKVDTINVAANNGEYNILACSHISRLTYGSYPFHYPSVDSLISLSQGKYIRYRDNSKFTDLESAQAYIQAQANAGTPIQLVAKLATPATYTIDPISLKTLRGINNIWSNANGNIELKYYTH